MEQTQGKTTSPAKKLEKTIRSGTRQLYVPLTQDEKNVQVKEMLANMDARAQCEIDITRMQESVKLKRGNIDLIDEAIGGCASKIKHGILKPIKCDTLYDWEGKKVIVTRLDTNEVIEDREMIEADKPMLTDKKANGEGDKGKEKSEPDTTESAPEEKK